MVEQRGRRRGYGKGWRGAWESAAWLGTIAAVALAAALFGQGGGETVSGQMRVVDGDSLAMGARRLRLIGIDAPELAQRCLREGFEYPCGVEAASHLRGLIGGDTVFCRIDGMDRYGRDLARCRVGSADLNSAMVAAGHAVSFGDYRAEEEAARSARAGLWAGEFDRPKDWRAVHGGLDEPLHAGAAKLWAFLKRLFGV